VKSIAIRIICLLTCVSACVRSGLAQGCSLVMTQNYSYYFTETTDDIKIYTTVVVDGAANCTPSPSCPCGSAVHTPKAYNQLGSTGGWGSGSPQCVNCYLSYQNHQSITATAGVQYPFVFGAEIACSVVGTFWTRGLFTAKVQRGHDYMWFDDGLPNGPNNSCSWALADSVQCHSTCRAIVDPITAPCYANASSPFYTSMLDIVPWVEVQLGTAVYGAGLNGSTLEVKTGSTGPAGACSAIPTHLGTRWQ
jgi:hypothetical protein